MKKLLATAILVFTVVGVVSGCGPEKGEQNQSTAGTMSELTPEDMNQSDTQNKKNAGQQEELNDTADQEAVTKESVNKEQQNNNEQASTGTKEEIFGDLFGKVESLTDDGFIISKYTFDEPGEEADPNWKTNEQITVHCTDTTLFQIFQIKNGGVNGPSDLSTLDAAIEDVKKGNAVNLTGKWDGDKYYAEKVGITREI